MANESTAHPVFIPMLNPNEPEALLAALYIHPGQRLSPGDQICTLETTKSTSDLVSEASGYVVGLNSIEGQMVRAGEILLYLAESPDWQPPGGSIPATEGKTQGIPVDVPPGLRITQPALALARDHGLDLAALPSGPMITVNMIRSLIAESEQLPAAYQSKDFLATQASVPADAFDSQAIIVYGGGGHRKMVVDLLRALATYRIMGIIDDGLQAGSKVIGVEVLGGDEALAYLYKKGLRLAANAVGGIGSISVRIKIFKRLAELGFTCPVLVHPTAFVEPSASLAQGVQLFVHTYVGSDARIGFGTIINTGAIISHDCQLGDFVNISPGAILAGEVQIGERVLVGMGVTINLGVKIGQGARIGNGATVKADVPENGIVRAGTIWPKQVTD